MGRGSFARPVVGRIGIRARRSQAFSAPVVRSASSVRLEVFFQSGKRLFAGVNSEASRAIVPTHDPFTVSVARLPVTPGPQGATVDELHGFLLRAGIAVEKIDLVRSLGSLHRDGRVSLGLDRRNRGARKWHDGTRVGRVPTAERSSTGQRRHTASPRLHPLNEGRSLNSGNTS